MTLETLDQRISDVAKEAHLPFIVSEDFRRQYAQDQLKEVLETVTPEAVISRVRAKLDRWSLARRAT